MGVVEGGAPLSSWLAVLGVVGVVASLSEVSATAMLGEATPQLWRLWTGKSHETARASGLWGPLKERYGQACLRNSTDIMLGGWQRDLEDGRRKDGRIGVAG